LTGAVRKDDNSAFGSEFSGATYPKASATWVISEESFWNVDLVETLRLRSAWGQAGQQPDVFAATRLYEPLPGPGFVPILTPQTIGNPELGPEKGEELELGFDATMLDERVNLEFTAFWRDTKDAIVTKQIAPSIGIPGTQLVNVGGISSWGTETSIGVAVLTENPVRWDIQASLASQNNEIVDLGGPQIMIPVRRARHHIEGFPLASIFGYEILSAEFVPGTSVVNKDTWLCDGGTGPGNRLPGGPAVNCSDAPRVYFGQPEPSFTVNVSSSWTLFESWQVFTTIDMRGGMMRAFDLLGALHNRSSRANQVQDDPIFMAYALLSRSPLTHHDNGFARWRDLSVRYEFPAAAVDRLFLGADRASILVGMHNVALLWWEEPYTAFGRTTDGHTGERAVDPEFITAQDDWVGETRGGMPVISDITVRLNVTF
jgi:hypothetical protein